MCQGRYSECGVLTDQWVEAIAANKPHLPPVRVAPDTSKFVIDVKEFHSVTARVSKRIYLWEKLGAPANPKSMPVFDPDELQKCCKEAGATNLSGSLLEIMSSPGQSKESHEKNKFKVVNIIYSLIYGQSQKCS